MRTVNAGANQFAPPERHSLRALSLIHLAAIHTGPLSDGLITQPGQVKERGICHPAIANRAAHSFLAQHSVKPEVKQWQIVCKTKRAWLE